MLALHSCAFGGLLISHAPALSILQRSIGTLQTIQPPAASTATHTQPNQAVLASQAGSLAQSTGRGRVVDSSSPLKHREPDVLGVLSSLLPAQQQQHQQQQQDCVNIAIAQAVAQAQQQGFGNCSSSSSSGIQSCQTDGPAASSGVVRMESQILFDSCWRRFKEKHDMVRWCPSTETAAGQGRSMCNDAVMQAGPVDRSPACCDALSLAWPCRRLVCRPDHCAQSLPCCSSPRAALRKQDTRNNCTTCAVCVLHADLHCCLRACNYMCVCCRTLLPRER